MDAGDYISLAACVVSVIAAILSFISYLLARKEHKLQLKLYADGLPNFRFKVIESCIKDNKECDKIQYWFNLLVTNMSDKQTSISEYILKLECLQKITFKPEYVTLKNVDVVCLELPQNIDAHSSIKGWCVFELPRDTFKELDIETCTVTLKDIHGKTDCQTPIYIKEELINYGID